MADWSKTLTLAAALGVPLTFLAASMSMGLVHGGMISAFILCVVVPGLLVGDGGWGAIIVVQIIYYIVVALVLRKLVFPYMAKRKEAGHAS